MPGPVEERDIWSLEPGLLWRGEAVLDRAFGIIVSVLLIFMMLLTCVDVAGRSLLSAPVPGAFELTGLAMGCLVFLALPMVTVRGEHVSITLLDGAIPEALRLIQFLCVTLLSVGVLGLFTWQIFETGRYLDGHNETTTFLRLPVAPFAYFLGVLGGLSAILLVLSAIGRLFRSDLRRT